MQNNSSPTTVWNITKSNKNNDAHEIMNHVFYALKQKGYDPVFQIASFIVTGDPTYITNHLQARSLICRLSREEIADEIVRKYLAYLEKEAAENAN